MTNSAERAQHPPPRVLAVDVVDDQLRDHRVVEIGDLVACANAGVDADTDSRGLAVGRDPPRGGQERAHDVLRVDPTFDRVAAELDLPLSHGKRLAGRDPDLLAHDVDAGDRLGDGVLDLHARVHLEEVVGAVSVEEALDRPGRAVADALAASTAIAPIRARSSSSTAGEGVSSTSF